MSFTPFNEPILAPLLGDAELTQYFAVGADIACMVQFERALATSLAACGLIPSEAARVIAEACDTFQPDMRLLGQGTERDGVVVPQFVKSLRAHVGDEHGKHVHFGATSQDVIDTSLILRLKDVTRVFETRLNELDTALSSLDRRFGGNALVGRTRMQAAIPMRAGARIGTWRRPLQNHRSRLIDLMPSLLQLQLGGAVGTLDKLGEKGAEVSRLIADELGLTAPRAPWHSDRSGIVEFAHWLALVTGTLGKIGQDIALMAQNNIDEIAVAGTGGSSAMPHKQNPIKAEALVTLARFNSVLISGTHHAMVHEQERSGAAWTLEWMLLPQMIIATGAATSAALEILSKTTRIGSSGLEQ